jgi:hypothetical protein
MVVVAFWSRIAVNCRDGRVSAALEKWGKHIIEISKTHEPRTGRCCRRVREAMARNSRFATFRSGFTQYNDQRIFLTAISKSCPEFWAQLRSSVLPKFPSNITARSLQKGLKDPAFSGMRPCYEVWSKKYGVTDCIWLQRVALRTLRMWKQFPHLNSFEMGAVGEFSPDFVVRFDPLLETEERFMRRTQIAFRSAVRGISASGRDKAPLPLNSDHAEWLVLHQFCGLSPSQIAQKKGIEQPNNDLDFSWISKGIRQAAKRLGVSLRKLPPGRKPSQR